MKPFSPRNWSKPTSCKTWASLRVLQAVALLTLAGGITGWLTREIWPALAMLAVCPALDWLLIAVMVRDRRSVGTLELSIGTAHASTVCVVGTPCQLTMVIRPRRTLRGVLLTPILPPGLESRGPSAVGGSLLRRQAHTIVFTIVPDAPGRFVIPGVIIRSRSLLGLGAIPRLLVDRTELTVLPNHAADSNPLVARFMRPLNASTVLRRHVTRGHGTDFHQLREYQRTDPMRSIDWKATARRRDLMVREFEEPTEYAINIVFDASVNMAYDVMGRPGFHNAAQLISQLAFVSLSQGFCCRVSRYSEHGVHSTTMANTTSGFLKLLGQLAEIPRASVTNAVAALTPNRRSALADQAWSFAQSRWGARALAVSRRAFLGRYLGNADDAHVLAEFITDVDPRYILDEPRRCDRCSGVVFADETACRQCEPAADAPLLTHRAAAAVQALFRATARTRGREMLVFISSLRGGEMHGGVLEMLQHASAGHRAVHLILPQMGTLQDKRPVHPKSLGHQPVRTKALANLERLRGAAQFRFFSQQLIESGIAVHAIDDAAALSDVVAKLLLNEVLAA